MSISNFIWPTLVQGIGTGLIFPNLSAAALSSISRDQMGYAASIYSRVRNIGGSIGTSVLDHDNGARGTELSGGARVGF
jgi:DHA2 family multidrug resistance protein